VYIFAHTKNQVYIPNTNNLHGNNIQKIEFTRKDKSYFADVDLARTELKSFDQSGERCEMTTKKLDTSACITKFLDDKLGCKFPFYKSTSLKSNCNTSTQYMQIFELTERLQYADAAEIYNMTGCLTSCNRDIYHMDKPAKKPVSFSKMRFQLRFKFETGALLLNHYKP
jgi:hypothetical protein